MGVAATLPELSEWTLGLFSTRRNFPRGMIFSFVF